jgi:Peptidase C13 family
MDIHYHLTRQDVLAGRKYVQDRMRERGERLGFWSALALGLLGGLLWQMAAHPGIAWVWITFVLVFASLAAWELYSLRVGHYVKWLGKDQGDYALDLGPDGISLRLPDGDSVSHAWHEVSAMEATPDYLFFYLRAGAALAVPCAQLERDGVQALSSDARKLWAAAPGNMGQALPVAPGMPESPSYQAWVNLREAVRAAVFLPFDPRTFRPAYGALAIHLGALAFMLAAISYLQALPIPLFNPAGVGPFGASVLLIVCWAAAVSLLMPGRSSLLRLLAMAVAALLFISMAAFFGYQLWLRHFGVAQAAEPAWRLAVALWILAVLARIVHAAYGRSRVFALALASVYLFLTLGLSALAPEGTLYLNAAAVQPIYAPAPDQEDGAAPEPNAPDDKDGNYLDDDEGAQDPQDPQDALDVEDVYYRQPELVRRALAAVRPHPPGETGLYFVGFAGDGGEHEFFNEVRYARGLLDRRFNTAGRSLMLVNSYDTVNDLPLANTHNLEAVLQGLAQRMDTQNDVLFLFLSSHGAQDHLLEVSLDPVEMDDLKAEKLKELLDKSGIRNRVIVVSACYSGGFLDVLKDDNTLVLTASRRDHVAYGCGDVTEYTYFGEAYFVKALEHGDSFINAFDEAQAGIAAREKEEGMDPSGPQISVGRNIVGVLRRLKVVPAADIRARAAGSSPTARCSQHCPNEGGAVPANP